MSIGQGGETSDHYDELEQQLADEELSLANKLEELAALERQIGMNSEADHLLEEAIDLDKRAKSHIENRIRKLKDALQRRNESKPRR